VVGCGPCLGGGAGAVVSSWGSRRVLVQVRGWAGAGLGVKWPRGPGVNGQFFIHGLTEENLKKKKIWVEIFQLCEED
jgi:hypothetical protein